MEVGREQKIQVLRRTSQIIDETIELANAITGDTDYLYNRLKYSMAQAKEIDIIVSFLMESGVKLILKDLKEAIDRGVQVRILTGNYLRITQPSALYLLRDTFGDQIDVRFYNIPHKSFHPKAYIFHSAIGSELYIGSSNISRGALTSSVEWNYRLDRSTHPLDFDYFVNTFEDLFNNHSVQVTEEVLKNYSKQWTKPQVLKQIEGQEEELKVISLFEPRGAQIEALYALKQTREEEAEKAIVVAATGIGKTYLAAFDSIGYNKVLFVAHREEILRQAATSFRNVRGSDSIGFFYGNQKDRDQEMTFALVQTLGKAEYLCEDYFAPDYFDYIVVDEFHHAVSNQYKNILDYFKPKFLLGLTATPERYDNKDVFALCDYNMVYEVRLKEAINKGWLVPFRYYGIYDDTVDYSQITVRNGKYDTQDLETKLMLHQRAEFILKNYQKYNSKRAMGFCASKSHAEYMAQYFTSKGIPAVAVYSGEQGEGAQARDTALKQLGTGEAKVVFSVDMFNEGIDVPSIDLVLFLRPTESPTVFLQQLGRGLRKYKNKDYLIVLDFIGNYKKANLIPFLLSGKPYDKVAIANNSPMSFEFPEECHIDFDFRLVDLFKLQAQREMTIKDRIKEEYLKVKADLGYVPSRVEFFLGMDNDVYQGVKGKGNLNPFSDYMQFLKDNGELSDEEEQLYNTIGREFINRIERTSMSKTYKMPVLLTFYNQGDIRMAVTDEELAEEFKVFYHHGANGKDLLQDKANRDFKTWDNSKWISLAKRNPVKFLLKSEGAFFEEREGYALGLNERLDKVKDLAAFKKHFKDAVDFRVLSYYKDRLDKQEG